MSAPERTFVRTQDPTLTAAIQTLGPDSYTAHRLQHANAEHLYLTTRRCFIGPIPEGWLKSHRKEWYKHYLGIHHSSKAPTFSAGDNTGSRRRMTGVDGPRIRPSFPQPPDAAVESDTAASAPGNGDDEEGDARDETSDVDATVESPPTLTMPRAKANPDDTLLKEESGRETEELFSSYESAPSRLLSSPPEGRHAAGRSRSRGPRSWASGSRMGPRKASRRSSYVTAASELSELEPDADDGSEATTIGATVEPKDKGSPIIHDGQDPTTPSAVQSTHKSIATSSPEINGQTGSTTSLLRNQHLDQAQHTTDMPRQQGSIPARNAEPLADAGTSIVAQPAPTKRLTPGQVKFNVPDLQPRKVELQVRARLAQMGKKRLPRSLTRGRLRSGEIVKMEKMLVRLDVTSGPEQPEQDFDEKDSQRVETRIVEKWREFMVVCRECDDDGAALALQMYKTRVIPATSESKVKQHWKHEILLDRATAKVNLYSSLDKTIVIWTPKGPRTRIYFLRTRSGADAVEWYHFLRSTLGMGRVRTLQINIPELSVTVRLDKPFESVMSEDDLALVADGDEAAIAKALEQEQAISGTIVGRCMDMLAQSGEWSDVLEAWASNDHVGLAWKRYDRLEWIHGAQEKKMYGSMAMLRTHELELRSKQHYPTTVKSHNANTLIEPPPVEGFLVRLTSQRGVNQKLGKLFFKRLYFTTQNEYLLFLRPAKAKPPPPPKLPMHMDTEIPSAKQIADKVPLIYAVNPYPTEDGTLEWLRGQQGGEEMAQQHDLDALDEAKRNIDTLLNCDGFIILSDVVKVRNMHRGATPADENVDEGSEVDFDAEVTDNRGDDGKTTEIDDIRTFELVMKNGLIVRLQAFNKATKKEWMSRLRDLVKYWRYRAAADMDLFKSVRRQNLQSLNIDERAEAYFGQFAEKWEVTKSYASPELYNMCGISSCRTIHNSGTLFRKKRKHSTFNRCYTILCHGHLIIFQDTLRTRTGKKQLHIHHERIASIDLTDCYIYSGLMTENDLLSQNQTFDSNTPGSHALPRMFLEDSWTSTDEDAMTCFVLWHSNRKGWFRSRGGGEVDDIRDEEKRQDKTTHLKRVSQLGVKGRSIVFKARSRAERDHWVLGISTEIERLAQQDEIRVIGDKNQPISATV